MRAQKGKVQNIGLYLKDHLRRSGCIGDQEKDRGGWKGEDVILVNTAYLNTCPKSFKAMRGKRKKVQLR